MELRQIGQSIGGRIIYIPQSALRQRLRQLGLTEGTMVRCRMAKKRIVALEWMGTVVALRRKDLGGIILKVEP